MSKIHYPKELFPSIEAWAKVNYIRNTAEDKGLTTTGPIVKSWEHYNSCYLTQYHTYIPFYAFLIKQKWETEEAAIAGTTSPCFSGTEVKKTRWYVLLWKPY